MAETERRSRRVRSKTWTSLGEVKRKPSEYEIVTHGMNHTYGRKDGGQPLEMSPDVHGNVWLREKRDAHLFGVSEWEGFRDPASMTYRKYCEKQDEKETYVDGVLENDTVIKSEDAKLSDTALQFLQLTWTPCRYLGHAQQMLASYIQQLGPSSFVANCATFQTADSLRRVERVSYRTKQLDNAQPMRGFGTSEREIWENDADWQPIRRHIEEALAEYDFDESFVRFQLIIRPIVDGLFLEQFADVAKTHGASTDAAIAENLFTDSQYTFAWTMDMVKYVIDKNPSAQAEMAKMVEERANIAEDLLKAGAKLLTRFSDDAALAQKIEARVMQSWTRMLAEAGIGKTIN